MYVHVQVVLARTLETGEVVAIKRIYIRNADEGVPENVIREIKCMQSMTHPNVVHLKDVYPKVCVPYASSMLPTD